MTRSRWSVAVLVAAAVLVPLVARHSAGLTQREDATTDYIPATGRGAQVPPELRPAVAAQGAILIAHATSEGIAFVPTCSVTHVGGGYAITAGHCVDAAREGRVRMNVRHPDLYVQWDSPESGGIGPLPVERLVWAQADHEVDFALLEVDGRPPRLALPVDVGSHIDLHTPLTLFSHPEGLPLRWSGWCEATDAPEFSLVHPGQFLAHSCRASACSSGAALIDGTTLAVVGVHTGRLLSCADAGPSDVEPATELLGNYAFRLEKLPNGARRALGFPPLPG